MEFVFLVGVAFTITLVLGVVFVVQQKEINSDREYVLLNDILLKTQGEILLASNIDDGYYREFTIPEKAEAIDYSLSISNNTFLVLVSGNHFFEERIPLVNGSIVKGKNIACMGCNNKRDFQKPANHCCCKPLRKNPVGVNYIRLFLFGNIPQ